MRDTTDFMQIMAREILRDILRFCHVGGLQGVTERMLRTAMATYKHHVLPGDIRRHLDYLEQRGVVKIQDRDADLWLILITPDGTDVVDGIRKTPDWMAPMEI